MRKKNTEKAGDHGVSKVKLAIGAASLFLFIIGVKRTFQMDPPQAGAEGRESSTVGRDGAEPAIPPAPRHAADPRVRSGSESAG